MEIRHLRYFVAMAEAGSLMKASERLHVAQPALSVHLSNLEIDLGVKLVRRSNRGIELTEEGELLYERATTLLKYHEEAILALKSRKVKAAGSVSLGLPSTMPGLITAPLYAAMRDELPDVSLYMVDASTAALFEWLQAGKIDFAVLFSLPESAGLQITPLYIEDFCLVGRPDTQPSNRDVKFDEIFDYPLMMPCAATSWRKILDSAAERCGKMLSSPIETESFSAMRAAALAGVCQAIMPRTSVHEEIRDGRLQARRIVDPDIRGLKALVQVENRVMTAAQREVGKLVARVVKDVMSELDLDMRGRPGELLTHISPSSLFQRGTTRRGPARPAMEPRGYQH